ncbi:MAG: hypothetical protein QGG42_13940 [Phycisphaerae bacterium]|nr:hypothetical protein [Phycisphaerae bacterium]
MLPETSPTSSKIGFRCMGPECGQWIGDLRYAGPIGHAPQNLCFECWMAHWEEIEVRAVNGGRWTYLDEAMWLVCRGLTLAQAADIVASNRMALRRWIGKMRRRPELVPDWLIHMQEIRSQRCDQQH